MCRSAICCVTPRVCPGCARPSPQAAAPGRPGRRCRAPAGFPSRSPVVGDGTAAVRPERGRAGSVPCRCSCRSDRTVCAQSGDGPAGGAMCAQCVCEERGVCKKRCLSEGGHNPWELTDEERTVLRRRKHRTDPGADYGAVGGLGLGSRQGLVNVGQCSRLSG